MPPNQQDFHLLSNLLPEQDNDGIRRWSCAILGCGMMGQEHVSYMSGYADQVSIDYLCDPHQDSLDRCRKVFHEFTHASTKEPKCLTSEEELLQYAERIDLLVIATPNYKHAGMLLRWANYDLTILLEKPAAISSQQIKSLNVDMTARIWVAMEYRFMPAISRLLQLRDVVGEIKMVTIRENRFPFLHKVGAWNRDPNKTGDTLVEKCCHFFDLMRLITGQEANLNTIRTMAQRGINYEDEEPEISVPIIDSAYVMMQFERQHNQRVAAMGCLELCMYADGSRHQEEIIVTGTKGRLEAYLPENKVYAFVRPNHKEWQDRSIPPPKSSVQPQIIDCNNVDHSDIPSHGGYHYGSTAVEWYRLLHAMEHFELTGEWQPDVSLNDGLRAVEIGLAATEEIISGGS